jgi:hypothetical protein
MDRDKLIQIIKDELNRQSNEPGANPHVYDDEDMTAMGLDGAFNIEALADAIKSAGEQGVYEGIEMEGIEPCPTPCKYPEADHDPSCPYKNSKPLLAHGTLITKDGETFMSLMGRDLGKVKVVQTPRMPVIKSITVPWNGFGPLHLSMHDTDCDELIVHFKPAPKPVVRDTVEDLGLYADHAPHKDGERWCCQYHHMGDNENG